MQEAFAGVGRADPCPPVTQLTRIGETVDKYIRGIEMAREAVFVDSYVIMPDHIHLLIRVGTPGNLNVKMRCLWQRGILLIIVAETKRKEAIPDAE